MEERNDRGKTWWEVIRSGDSGRLLLHRRNTVHFKRTNEPPPKLTFEESPKVSSYPDDTGDRVHLEESFDAEEAPCIEPCKDTLEQDLVGMTRTHTCSWTLCLCVIDIELATVHDLAFFLFVIYSDLIKNSFRFVLFFFHIGEDVKY